MIWQKKKNIYMKTRNNSTTDSMSGCCALKRNGYANPLNSVWVEAYLYLVVPAAVSILTQIIIFCYIRDCLAKLPQRCLLSSFCNAATVFLEIVRQPTIYISKKDSGSKSL